MTALSGYERQAVAKVLRNAGDEFRERYEEQLEGRDLTDEEWDELHELVGGME